MVSWKSYRKIVNFNSTSRNKTSIDQLRSKYESYIKTKCGLLIKIPNAGGNWNGTFPVENSDNFLRNETLN